MTSLDFSVRLEESQDALHIDQLVSTVFGPGMFARAAYALREGVPHEPELSFIATLDGELIGSVRLTKILWGKNRALMLGPLAVLQQHAGMGVGKALMNASVEASQSLVSQHGCNVIMLVGDLSYYQPFGFKRIPHGKIVLPRPADPYRILATELSEDALAEYSGVASAMNRN